MLKKQLSNQFTVGEGKAHRRFLEPEQLCLIEEALESVGAYGEVRLVVEKGRLRFVTVQKSYDALNLGAQVFAKDGK